MAVPIGIYAYRWRLKNGIYYVFIDGNWVQMPDDWKPGEPLPEV